MATTVGLISLGCSKNRVDSEQMLAVLKEHGYQVVSDPSRAEIIIVNTCGFIQSAKEEAISTLFEMAGYKQTGCCRLLVATGCFAQRYPEAIREEFLKNRGRQFDPELTDLFLRLMDEHRLYSPSAPLSAADTSGLSAVDSTIGKFISDVMSTMKSQEDAASYDFLTRLPMRHLGERLAAEFMQEHSGYLVFIDMDNLKKINDLYGH